MERKRNKLQKRGGSDAAQGIMSQHWPYKQSDQQLSPGLRPEGGGGSSKYKAYNAYSAGASPVASPTGGSFGVSYQAVSPGGSSHHAPYASPGAQVVSPTYANHSPYATGLVSPRMEDNNGWGHVPSASGGYSKSWNGEGSGYMAELETPPVGPLGQVVFEMSGESIPVTARSDDGGERARKKEEEEVSVPVQANPWPFYLDLPITSSDGDSQDNAKGKKKEEQEPQPQPAVPWPYHGPGDSSNPSVTIQPAAEPQRRKSAGDGDKPKEREGEDAGMSVLDEYLSDMGIGDDDLQAQNGGEGEGVERKDSMLKVRPLSLASRMRASSVGAVPAGGKKTYMAYNPSSMGGEEGTEASNAQPQQPQQSQYPVGTAPHHFYIPQGLAPPRKPLPSGSPVSPTFPSGPLSPPHNTQTPSSNPLSPPKQPRPAPLSPPAPASEGRSSPGYVAYRPYSKGTSSPGNPSPGYPPPSSAVPPGSGGFVAYNPDGPSSPTQAAPPKFTSFNGPTAPREESARGFATYRKPTVSSPSEEPTAHFATTMPYPADDKRMQSQPTSPGFGGGLGSERYASPPAMEQPPPHRYASPPSMDQPNRYASPPAMEGRLASPPINGSFPRPSSRQDSPAQPSPVSSLGGGAQQVPHRVSPNTTGGRNPSPYQAPPPIPQNQPPQEQYHHSTPPPVASPNGSATGAAGQGLGLPPSPGVPSSPPPPYMPVDLPPRPGSAGIPPSYRSSPSPPPRVGSYGPLRPSVTGDGNGYTRPHAQSQPHVPSSRPQVPPPQSQHEAPPPLPPRRTTSPPLPPLPPQMPPRPTAAPQGFGRGVPSAMNFPPPPKASSHPRPAAAHTPRPPPARPPPAPSTQRPQGQPSSSSSSQRPGHIGGPHQRPPPQQNSSHSSGSGWRPPMNTSSGSHSRPQGGVDGRGPSDMFWSASAKKWLYKTERLVEQTLGDIMQPQVDQGRGQMPGGYPRGRGR